MDSNAAAVTPAQLRALHAGFNRLGYTKRSHRPERLAAASAALGLEQLRSFNDLQSAQAGYLIRVLRRSAAGGIDGDPGEQLPGSNSLSRQDPVRAPAAGASDAVTRAPRHHGYVAAALCALALAIVISNSAADPAGVALALGLLIAIADRSRGPGTGTASSPPMPA